MVHADVYRGIVGHAFPLAQAPHGNFAGGALPKEHVMETFLIIAITVRLILDGVSDVVRAREQ